MSFLFALLFALVRPAAAMSPTEGSGTSLQAASPMEGLHAHRGPWMLMTHGSVFAVYDRQGGPRGGEKFFSASMLMSHAERAWGPGRLTLRAMASLDPLMGPSGYPLLLQTGETSNGREPLTDRQHPHDLFMELAARYSFPVSADATAFVYFGLPGEPSLGPTAFMHRFSGYENPAAPLSHHWLDSTHIANGVLTGGAKRGAWQLEGSVFTGREPDRHRWDIEKPTFDSFSGRLTWQPGDALAAQYSFGRLESPEQLEPDVDVDRHTASVQWNLPLASLTQLTAAWGRNTKSAHHGGHSHSTNAFLLEAAGRVAPTVIVFGRAERLEKDELFRSGEPLAGETFAVGALTLGGVWDAAKWKRALLGVGASLTYDVLPAGLKPAYGDAPVSAMAWVRVKLI